MKNTKPLFFTYAKENDYPMYHSLGQVMDIDWHYVTKSINSIVSTKKLFLTLINTLVNILLNRNVFNNREVVIAMSLRGFILSILMKLRFIKIDKLICYHFFIHNPKNISKLKKYMRLIIQDKITFVVFTNYELELYSREFDIPIEKIRRMYQGDWQQVPIIEKDSGKGDYYFSGGYSNRDYHSLIKAFEGIDQKLVIIGSKLNKDLAIADTPEKIPSNITIMRDVERRVFDDYLRNAKACILSFKFDAGAAGHEVMLNCARNSIPVIASKCSSIIEYIDDGENGLIISDIVKDLPDVIKRLEEDPSLTFSLVEGMKAKYEEKYSPAAMQKNMVNIIQSA